MRQLRSPTRKAFVRNQMSCDGSRSLSGTLLSAWRLVRPRKSALESSGRFRSNCVCVGRQIILLPKQQLFLRTTFSRCGPWRHLSPRRCRPQTRMPVEERHKERRRAQSRPLRSSGDGPSMPATSTLISQGTTWRRGRCRGRYPPR